jgi:hypothetical protein
MALAVGFIDKHGVERRTTLGMKKSDPKVKILEVA